MHCRIYNRLRWYLRHGPEDDQLTAAGLLRGVIMREEAMLAGDLSVDIGSEG